MQIRTFSLNLGTSNKLFSEKEKHCILTLTLSASTAQNGQTHSKNLLTVADKFFQCVFLGVGLGLKRIKLAHMVILKLFFTD